ncbi:unnamed protein product [Hyaloperonospora brassicae]|uniref:RxLR effector candidate protein n=1 Tax=Hyaloperonospora brassicae TaxID=162125 RepID=A0AAV0UQN4_HYABA|nr:unnamed protein product [Hyaloperonospora brassicae]
MRLLSHVLAAVVFVVAETARSANTVGFQAKVAAHTTSPALSRTNETLSFASSVGKHHDRPVFDINDEDQNEEERAMPFASHFESILKWFRSFFDGTKTKTLVGNVVGRMTAEQIVDRRKVVKMDEFVQLLAKEFQVPNRRWNYAKVVDSLTTTGVPSSVNQPHVEYEDLITAFVSLRKLRHMGVHADRMHAALVEKMGHNLPERLYAQWIKLGLTPDEALEIVLTGHEAKFSLFRRYYHGVDAIVHDFMRPVDVVYNYVEAYRRRYSYSEDAEAKLYKVVADTLKKRRAHRSYGNNGHSEAPLLDYEGTTMDGAGFGDFGM